MAQLVERRISVLWFRVRSPPGGAKIPLVCHDIPFTIGIFMRNMFHLPPHSGGVEAMSSSSFLRNSDSEVIKQGTFLSYVGCSHTLGSLVD